MRKEKDFANYCWNFSLCAIFATKQHWGTILHGFELTTIYFAYHAGFILVDRKQRQSNEIPDNRIHMKMDVLFLVHLSEYHCDQFLLLHPSVGIRKYIFSSLGCTSYSVTMLFTTVVFVLQVVLLFGAIRISLWLPRLLIGYDPNSFTVTTAFDWLNQK